MYSLEFIEDFFRAENDADGRRSFATVERSMLDRLPGGPIQSAAPQLDFISLSKTSILRLKKRPRQDQRALYPASLTINVPAGKQ